MTNNLDRAVLAITRIGSFSEGEKDALTKAFRTSGFPGNWNIVNPTNGQILSFNGTDWVNTTSPAGATTFSALTDTPPSITANGFVKGNSGATALEYVTNVAETDAAETISGAWNFTVAPTISSSAVITAASNIDALNDVDTTGKASGDYLSWNGTTNWVKLTPPTFNTISGNPMTTNEDLIKRSGGVAARVPVGSDGQVLTVTGGVVGWANSAAGFADPLTTRGDIMIRDSSNTTARLAIGTTGKYLKSDGTDISWQTPAFADTSPMTTNEDIIKQSGGVATRLPVGTDGQVLTVTAGVVGWANSAAGFADPMTTRGDIMIRNSSNVTARLAIGTNGKVLTSNGTDVSWQTPSSGVTTFVALTDTPSSYTSQGLKWVRVNTGATALEFVTAPVTSVAVTAPISNSGTGVAPNIGIVASSAVADGYMSSSQWSKLNGIEAGADVTDAGNVETAGAIMDGDFSSNGYMARTAAGAYAPRTLTATTPMAITNGDGTVGNPVISIATGTTASTVCIGNDSRLSDARTPTAHTHTTVDDVSGLAVDINGITETTADASGDMFLVYDTSASANRRILASNVKNVAGIADHKFTWSTSAPVGPATNDIWIDTN